MKYDIKKLIYKLFLVTIPITFLLLYCALFPMDFLDGEVALYKQQKDYINNTNDYNKVLILGDSRAKSGFIPKNLSKDTYNLALGGVSSPEMYITLRNYLENHEKPKTVFIAFAPTHSIYADAFWTRGIYFHYLSTKEFIEIMKKATEYNDKDYLIDNYLTEYINYKLYLPNKYAAAIKNSKDREKINDEKYIKVNNNKGQIYFGQAKVNENLNQETVVEKFVPSKTIDYYLNQIIELCINNEIDVIIEQIPFNKASYDGVSAEFVNGYQEYMESIQKKYPSIIVNTELSYLTNDNFGDPSHLNEQGAKKYTNMILRKYNYIFNDKN